MTNNKQVATQADNEMIQALRESYAVEEGFQRTLLPRISMVSQDITEEVKNPRTGKKEIKVLVEAGTFFLERQTEEVDENGKKVWTKDELGTEIEATIIFKRRQLRFYDSANKIYTSSPVYDTDADEIPLYCSKAEVDRGTPKELKARPEYQGVTAKGKPTSKLEDQRVLYVLFDGEIFQMTVRGTSMYALMSYEKTTHVPEVLTKFGSDPQENGTTKWNQMTFNTVKALTPKEITTVFEHVTAIKDGIASEKEFYNAEQKANKDFNDGFAPTALKAGK